MNLPKLSKLLALASSSNDAEALTAMRMARNLLAKDGLDFVDVGALLEEAGKSLELEEQVVALKREMRMVRRERGKVRGLHSDAHARDATVADLKRQLATEKATRRASQAESARLTERVEQIEGMWRRSSQRRTALNAELKAAQAEIAALQARTAQLESRNRRLAALATRHAAHHPLQDAEHDTGEGGDVNMRVRSGRRTSAPQHTI